MRACRNWRRISLAALLAAAPCAFPPRAVSAAEPPAAAPAPAAFRTATVTRGDLTATVNATGTMEPEEVVDVGAQVTGIITALGIDEKRRSLGIDEKRSTPGETKTIDYGSVVEAGTVLARIDDTLYKAQVEQSRAGCMRADAELAQAKAKLALANAAWQRAQEQSKSKSISASDLDAAKCNYEVAQAAIDVAEATVVQSKVALKMAETNLDYTRIRSPVNGLIISRRVNVGQTVVADLSAASLFLIAKDLRRIQVWASVNEADVTRIRPDMPTSFTVDAYPGETFHGTVLQVRLNAQMTQNVVTYTVVVKADNADLRLLPYLTANVKFEIERHSGVLLVSNAALRWKPQPQRVLAEFRDAYRAGTLAAADAQAPEDVAEGTAAAKAADTKSADAKSADTKSAAGGSESKSGGHMQRGLLWGCAWENPDLLLPIRVRVGATDGIRSLVIGKGLKEGMQVICGEAGLLEAPPLGDAINPFAPKLFKKSTAAKKEP